MRKANRVPVQSFGLSAPVPQHQSFASARRPLPAQARVSSCQATLNLNNEFARKIFRAIKSSVKKVNPLESTEEWLGSKEGFLRSWLAKAAIPAISALGIWLSIQLPETRSAQLLSSLLVLSLSLAAWLFARVCMCRAELRKVQDALKKKPVFQRKVYFLEGEDVPCCPHCYDKDAKLIHLSGPFDLHANEGKSWSCTNCRISWTAESDDSDFHLSKPRTYKTAPKKRNWATDF